MSPTVERETMVEKFKIMSISFSFFTSFFRLPRWFWGKMQQVGQVINGKRKHPVLSISGRSYRRWIRKHECLLSEQKTAQLKKECREFKYKPLISIVVPAYNTPGEWLEKAIKSVLNQLYEKWELCIVNDGSTEGHVEKILDNYSQKDNRVKVKHLRRNRGIAGASNEALAILSGKCEFIAFMDSDDMLHPMALFEVVEFLNVRPHADVIYTDEDKLTLEDRRRKPEFKPDWSSELFLTYNYINHLTVCRKKLVDDVGGFRSKYNWSQDYDLYLRVTEKTDKIFHISKILYHWRAVPGSSASKVDTRPVALAKSKELLIETLRRRGIDGSVTCGLRPGSFKIKKKKIYGITFFSREDFKYQKEIRKMRLTKKRIEAMEKKIDSFAFKPKISIIMPVYNVEQEWLEDAIDSVLNQVYRNWELCIADDASSAPHIKKVLTLYQHSNERVIVKYLEKNQGISGSSNKALSLATGQYVAFLDHDDRLSRESLYEVVKLLNRYPEAEIIYTDEDKLSMGGMRLRPVYKPGWDPELFLTYNYFCHLVVCSRKLVSKVGGFRKGFEGSQDYDLLLRVTELSDKIFHIPKILYHWRMIPGSAASVVDAKPKSFERAKIALRDAMERRGIGAVVSDGDSIGTFRVKQTKNGKQGVI